MSLLTAHHAIIGAMGNGGTEIKTITIAGKTYNYVKRNNLYILCENLDAPIGNLNTDYTRSSVPEYGCYYKWGSLFETSGQPKSALASIIPEGWRVPTKSDLRDIIGGDSDYSAIITFAGGNNESKVGFSPNGWDEGNVWYHVGSIFEIMTSTNYSTYWHISLRISELSISLDRDLTRQHNNSTAFESLRLVKDA